MKKLVKLFMNKLNIKKEDKLVIRTLGIGKDYLSNVYLSTTLDSELRKEFIEENRDVEILNIGNEDITIVDYKLYNKWSTKQKEKNCNCREYEIKLHSKLIKELILNLIKKLNIEILEKEMKYENKYLYLKVKKNENIAIFEDALNKILDMDNERDQI